MSDDPSKIGGQAEGQGNDGRFLPGNRLGRGRKAGSRNKATLVLDALADEKAKTILEKQIELAEGGDQRAAEIVLSRVWPPRKAHRVSIDLPEIKSATDALAAQSVVVAAAADGEITLDEAQALSALVDAHRRAIETTELEARIKAIEEAMARK